LNKKNPREISAVVKVNAIIKGGIDDIRQWTTDTMLRNGSGIVRARDLQT